MLPLKVEEASSLTVPVALSLRLTLVEAALPNSSVSLSDNATGTVKLDASSTFSGSITGLNLDDVLDLGNVLFSDQTTVNYSANLNGTGGTLTVSDGTHTSNVALLGQYSLSSFHLVADSTGGTLLLNDHPLV